MSMTEPGKGRLAAIKLGFIGVGNMGGAIIKGLLAGGEVPRENLIYYDPDPARQAQMDELGVAAALDNPEVMHAPVVVLAVKPQVLPAVLAGVKEFARPWHLIISIAAGVPLAVLEEALPDSRVIRVMPNTPTLVGAGMAALAPGRGVTPEDLALALDLFRGRGTGRGGGGKTHGRGHRPERQRPGLCGRVHRGPGRRRGENGAAPAPGPHPGHPDGPGHGPPLP